MGRNIFDELVEGFDALADERQGKRTLKAAADLECSGLSSSL